MADPASLTQQDRTSQIKEVIEGTVYKTPESISDWVVVVIPSFSENHVAGPLPWTPQLTDAGIYFPHAGDKIYLGQVGGFERVVLGWERSGVPDLPPLATQGELALEIADRIEADQIEKAERESADLGEKEEREEADQVEKEAREEADKEIEDRISGTNYGLVTVEELEEIEPSIGDQAELMVSSEVSGRVWDLVADGDSEETGNPWAKKSGRPLISTKYAEIQRKFAGYDGTGAPGIIAPISMQFAVTIEDTYAKMTNSPAGADGTLRALYIAGVQKIVFQVNIGEPLFGGAQSVQRAEPYAATKGQFIQSAYASALGNTIGYVNMSLLVDPIRVG